MKKYTRTGIVEAKPMTLGEYNLYRGWTIPPNENPNDDGYLIKRIDESETWSPKIAFEESHKEII